MTVRGLCAVLWLAGVTAIGGACVNKLSLDQRPCNCAPGYSCCERTNTCVTPAEAADPACQLPPGPGSERADGGDVRPDTVVPADLAPAVDAPAPPDMAEMLPPDAPPVLPPDPPPMLPPHPPPDVRPRDCATGARRCLADGRTPQTCSADGQWVTELTCELRCLEGTCTACSPGARRCDASTQPQLCSATGHWQSQAPCADGDTCMGGLCRCYENCDQGSVLNTPVGLVDLAAGGDSLWYHDLHKLWRVDPTTGQAIEVHAAALPAGYQPVGGLAVDTQGNLFWCRQAPQAGGSEVMRNGSPFLSEPCRDLQLVGSHLFVQGESTLSRFPLAGSGGNQVGAGAITAFAAGDSHVFYGLRGAGSFSFLYRNSASGSGNGEQVWEQPMRGGAVTSVALDAEHVYFSPGQVLLRQPIGGGQAAIAQESDSYFSHVLLTDTHIYWTTSELGTCAAEVYRRPKQAPGSPHRLIRDEGRCPTALVLHGDALYLGTSADGAGLAPGRIIRLRK